MKIKQDKLGSQGDIQPEAEEGGEQAVCGVRGAAGRVRVRPRAFGQMADVGTAAPAFFGFAGSKIDS